MMEKKSNHTGHAPSPAPTGDGLDAAVMAHQAEKVAALMKVLSHKGRLMVLCELADGERSVGSLAHRLGVRPQAMSQQLALLRKDGLVATRREGQTIYYRLARDDVRRLMRFLYDTYCAAPAAS